MMATSIPDSLRDRFLLHVDQSGGETACWPWTGGRFQNGYGRISFGGKSLGAHRISFELFVGPIPAGMFVCHNCPGGDNRWCVNPAHLWVGTLAENNRDQSVKGVAQGNRHHIGFPGEAHPHSKLTDADVVAIRSRYTPKKVTVKMLAAEFGISETSVRDIVHRRSWSHVD